MSEGSKKMVARRAELRESEGRTGLRAMGDRRELTAQVKAMMERSRNLILKEFANDADFDADLVRVLKSGALARDRTCLKAVLHIKKLVGAERTLVIEFLRARNISSEAELDRIVNVVKSAESSDLYDAAERSTTHLEAILNIHPELRDQIVRRLGGLVPVPE